VLFGFIGFYQMRLPRTIIGITGGIAMGKTVVSRRLELHYGLTVLDADVYARDAVAIGSPILESIRLRYGAELLLPDGQLDRAALGKIIFASPEERTWLETQIHPEVRLRMKAETRRYFDRYSERQITTEAKPLIWVVPLLFETAMTDLVDEIWVVCCDRDQQIQRLCDRSSLTYSEVERRILAQWDIQKKCDRADLILDNSGSVDFLYEQIEQALCHKDLPH
jgi:dephospho-CoA kinase